MAASVEPDEFLEADLRRAAIFVYISHTRVGVRRCCDVAGVAAIRATRAD